MLVGVVGADYGGCMLPVTPNEPHTLPSATDPSAGEPLPAATIRQSPEDFVVDELPAYAPSGQGEHAILTFRKRGLTTPDAVRRIAGALGLDANGAGFAGMKDRHAVTTQAASFYPFAASRDLAAAVAALALPGIEILGASRNEHKLKPGHLRGNRFTIRLRDLGAGAAERIAAKLDGLAAQGIPNAFGPQRFGRDGDNPERALAWLAGKARPPRSRTEQRFLFSAVQSLLFNRVLERRQAEGTWAGIVPGDLAKKHETGGLFAVADSGPELEDARRRAGNGEICATGPMFGAKMTWPGAAAATMEREILEQVLGGSDTLQAFKHLGRGTRRPFVLRVSEASSAANADNGHLALSFVLPKGGYATTVLAQLCRPLDAHGQSLDTAEGFDEPD